MHRADTGSIGETLVDVRALSVPARTPFAVTLKNISLKVRAGEVLAIAGVAGNGQGELFDALSGNIRWLMLKRSACVAKPVGRIGINGRRKLGAGFVPEERHGHAAVSDMSLSDNLLLSRSQSDRAAVLTGGLASSSATIRSVLPPSAYAT